MKSNRAQRRTAWIAVFAILLNACAPTISRALAAHRGPVEQRAEVTRGVDDAAAHDAHANNQSTPGTHHAGLDHCPYCVVHAGSFGLAALPAVTFAVPSGPDLPPAAFLLALPPPFAWAVPPPRAPPAAV